jgi:hypothetical protein
MCFGFWLKKYILEAVAYLQVRQCNKSIKKSQTLEGITGDSYKGQNNVIEKIVSFQYK